MNFLPRTDLALEEVENEKKIDFNKEDNDGIIVEKIVLDEVLAKKLKKETRCLLYHYN